MTKRSALTASITLMVVAAASAQSPSTAAGPTGAAEFIAGYAGFVDDATIDHALVGGAARWYVTRRLSIGPEIVYLRGPESDRDLFVTGNLTYDLAGGNGRRPRVIPFLVAGAGFMRHRDRFGGRTFSSGEGAFTAGGGVRVRLTARTFGAGEARCGWELHCRLAGTVGVGFGR